MTGLILKLTPKERILLNGAVLENGNYRNKLSILTPNVHLLRLKDAIPPEEANTPVRRLCFTAQLVLSGDRAFDEQAPQLLRGIEELSQVLTDPDSRAAISLATDALMNGQTYNCLKSLKKLISREARLLAAANA